MGKKSHIIFFAFHVELAKVLATDGRTPNLETQTWEPLRTRYLQSWYILVVLELYEVSQGNSIRTVHSRSYITRPCMQVCIGVTLNVFRFALHALELSQRSVI